jgi:hypothetical protein
MTQIYETEANCKNTYDCYIYLTCDFENISFPLTTY